MTNYNDARPQSGPLVNDLPPGTRPQSRLCRDGAGVLSEAELIALLLGKPDGLTIAYKLLADCGRVDYLTRYTVEELAALPGMGKVTACRVLAAVELGRRVVRPREYDMSPVVRSPSDAANLLMPDMMHLLQEQLKVIMLDSRNKVIAVRLVYQGTGNTIHINPADVFRPAIVSGAAAIIVAHNHPSNDPSPSPEDISISRLVSRLGDDLGVSVLDHIIIGMCRYVSLAERGLVRSSYSG